MKGTEETKESLNIKTNEASKAASKKKKGNC